MTLREPNKRCPECGHPMMSAVQPLRGQGDNRIASWWCANCHYTRWFTPKRVDGKIVKEHSYD